MCKVTQINKFANKKLSKGDKKLKSNLIEIKLGLDRRADRVQDRQNNTQ
jgi:hypothetical protein